MDIEFNKRRRRRKLRRALISKLIHSVLSGDFDNTPALFNLNNSNGGARRTYYGPHDRSSFNYGYMEIDEMQSPNN